MIANRAISISTAVVFFFLIAPASSAQIQQFIPFTGNERIPLVITMTPVDPAPGETVTLSLTSSAIDLDRSVITWSSNGTQIPSDSSPKQITLQAPELGAVTTIEAKAETPENVARASARIVPIEMDILWSADSYVPPFYKGRTLPGSLSTIRAFALVRFKKTDGSFVPERDIVYTWLRNNAVISSVSGRGRAGVLLPGPQLFGNDTITLRAESLDRSFKGETDVRIPGLDTQLYLYENHPLFGILYHRAIIGEVNTLEREQKVTAVPFFARALSPNDPSLDYEWYVNQEYIPSDENEPQTLTIDATNFSGRATVELKVTSFSDIAMLVKAKWVLIFGESGTIFSQSPFGN